LSENKISRQGFRLFCEENNSCEKFDIQRKSIRINGGTYNVFPNKEKPVCDAFSFFRWRQCPGSRILIFTHPGSRIPDTGSKNSNKERG
jgi:hypothetical protein